MKTLIFFIFFCLFIPKVVFGDDLYDHTDHNDGKGCFSPCFNQPPNHVPEPDTLMLLALGGVALFINRRKK